MKVKSVLILCCSAVCCFAACAGEQSTEEWLNERVGTVSSVRADEIIGMLAELEQEHHVVLEKHALVENAVRDVTDDKGLTRFARKIAQIFETPYADVQAEYVRFEYVSQIREDVSDSLLKLLLNDEMKCKPQKAKAQVCRLLASQSVNRDKIGRGKSDAWHQNLNDVLAICLGCGKILMDSVQVERKTVDDGTQTSLSMGMSL